MPINKKLIHFNSRDNFMSSENGVNNSPEVAGDDGTYGNLKGTSIVFIKDSKEIWTHGNLYKSVNWSNIEPEYDIQQVGDVVYWNGDSFKTSSLNGYRESMGQAVGVVVIPNNFLPDGKARMIALYQENNSNSWGDCTDTGLTNYSHFPTTDNVDLSASSVNNWGILPSDRSIGESSFADPSVTYTALLPNAPFIPSPYLQNGIFNPEYSKGLNQYSNALSDFDGKSNTDYLVNLGEKYVAANVAKNYKIENVGDIDWYLPSVGELGVMITRFNKINKTIEMLGGNKLPINDRMWTSTEYSADYAYVIITYYARIDAVNRFKTETNCVRSFAILN